MLTHLFWTSRKLNFDTPPRELLKSKLFGYGIGGKTLSWIDSFLCYRTQRAVVNGEFSEWAPVLSGGWSGGAKVLCILHHWGVQLILAYSWARPAILVVGKGRGGVFLFLLFLHFHSCSSFFPVPLFHLLYSLFYLFSPFLWETTQNDPQGLTCR